MVDLCVCSDENDGDDGIHVWKGKERLERKLLEWVDMMRPCLPNDKDLQKIK